ncbi:hypothetical protein Geob_3127 [Geotalea daltonii FRC-32]|uniref:DUF4062 domain-containing protein n=1 Tax=Geotalea daltonii (strain DSM 22248 / JCM 15807 / FRC-32) TaxID=316067 RepID=B9M3P9_GEODF|nr:DUF4062 domain-containing protein [Geotalea daltonii]ACM21470.1 hypothetical protein Geob_3127 [Geotalea daltonii FRC-32]
MANSRRFVKVFLASPGDLSDERKIAKTVVDEFNSLWAEQLGYQVELVGWEDTVARCGRPQALINRDLEQCELFVGLMWKRWGTPPDVAGTYSSGFEEEFNRSVERRKADGLPEISLLFKEIDTDSLRDPGAQLKKVLDFKEQLITEKTILFEHFSDFSDFEKKFRRCIADYIKCLCNVEGQVRVNSQSQAPPSEDEKQQTSDANAQPLETPLSIEGAQFLRDFISKTERDLEQEPIEGAEIARFRLLTTILGKHGNDEYSLGVHDSNLMFAKGDKFKLGQHEISGLVASGLSNFSNENVPLWRWLAAMGEFSNSILPFYTFKGPTERRINAITAMKLISEPLPSGGKRFNRDFLLKSWFSDNSKSALRVAALNYLGEFGITSDISIIRAELDRNDNQTNNAATDAFLRIKLRESRECAILALNELRPSFVHQDLMIALFDNEAALSTESLISCIDQQCNNVRRKAIEILRKRKALPLDTVEQLLCDNDAKVRYEAINTLIEHGRTFSNDEAKKILVKPSQKSGLGMLSIASGITDETYWNHYQHHTLRLTSEKELEKITEKSSIFDFDPKFILAERQFKKRGDILRKSVEEQFKEEFSNYLNKLSEIFTMDHEVIERTRGIEDYQRKSLTRKGLNIICQKAELRDLGLVRNALKSGFVDYSSTDVEYLRKFGEWEDIKLIIDSVKRPEAGQNTLLLSTPEDSKYQVSAKAIYALGRNRLTELLSMQLPSQLLSYLIVETPDKAFRELTDETIIRLLQYEDEKVRKCIALKCIRALTKKRLIKLLADYMSSDEQQYYNVIHWLDFGVSTPRDRAIQASDKVLKKEWNR